MNQIVHLHTKRKKGTPKVCFLSAEYNDNSVTFLKYRYIKINLICLVTGNVIMVTQINDMERKKNLETSSTI